MRNTDIKKKYREIVLEYFRKKGNRFLKQYKTFEHLKQAHNKALNEWSSVKEDTKHHGIYHKHANLSTTFKSIKNKLKTGKLNNG